MPVWTRDRPKNRALRAIAANFDGSGPVDAAKFPHMASTTPSNLAQSTSPDVQLPRRRALVVLTGVGLAPLVACGSSADGTAPGLDSPLDPDRDAGDAGTLAPNDAGTTTPSDGGTSVHDAPTASDSGGATCSPKGVSVGATSSFPANRWTGVKSLNVIVGHDAGGLYAYTAVCTHRQCSLVNDVDASTGLIDCNCHHYKFDANGNCTNYTAAPLQHYALESCGGQVYVDVNTNVDQTTRTAP